jgi:hypothetical protein
MKISTVGCQMDVDIACCLQESGFKIAMLNVVASSTVEMADAAVLTDWSADTLRYEGEIDVRVRIPREAHGFNIGTAVIVATKAIYVKRIAEIERSISPPISDMA